MAALTPRDARMLALLATGQSEEFVKTLNDLDDRLGAGNHEWGRFGAFWDYWTSNHAGPGYWGLSKAGWAALKEYVDGQSGVEGEA